MDDLDTNEIRALLWVIGARVSRIDGRLSTVDNEVRQVLTLTQTVQTLEGDLMIKADDILAAYNSEHELLTTLIVQSDKIEAALQEVLASMDQTKLQAVLDQMAADKQTMVDAIARLPDPPTS